MYFLNVTECLRNDWNFQEIVVNGCKCLEMGIKQLQSSLHGQKRLVKAKNGLENDRNGLKWFDIKGNGFNILEIPGHVEIYDAVALASEIPGEV